MHKSRPAVPKRRPVDEPHSSVWTARRYVVRGDLQRPWKVQPMRHPPDPSARRITMWIRRTLLQFHLPIRIMARYGCIMVYAKPPDLHPGHHRCGSSRPRTPLRYPTVRIQGLLAQTQTAFRAERGAGRGCSTANAPETEYGGQSPDAEQRRIIQLSRSNLGPSPTASSLPSGPIIRLLPRSGSKWNQWMGR